MVTPEHIAPSEQADPKQAEPLTLDKETLKDLDLSPQDAANVKGGIAPLTGAICTYSESCKRDGCSNLPTC